MRPESETLKVLRTVDEISGLIDYLQDKDIAAYDDETDGLALSAQVIGFSVAAEETIGFYVVLAEYRLDPPVDGQPQTGKLVFLDNREKAIELLNLLREKSLIMHNATVDVQWTRRNFGVDLMPALTFETMVAAHLLNENRRVGLKELGYAEYGEDARREAIEMKESVIARGGTWEEKRGGNKEMFKADPEILGKYGAKDAVLTYKLFLKFAAQLVDQGLDEFYYRETLPLFKGPIYDLNTTGLRVDMDGLRKLQKELEDECAMLKSQIETDIAPYTAEDYPKGFGNKAKQFNIGAGQQLAWLIFIRLKQDWKKLTNSGRDLSKELMGKAPYNPGARRNFVLALADSTDEKGRPLKLQKYLSTNKTVLTPLAQKYLWIERLLKYKKSIKLLNTYVIGMQEKAQYGIIRPSFLQHGTTGNRLSSRGPNFQNLPAKDKRVKKCIIARAGKVIVGGDFEQIEPRVFASLSGDRRLMECFAQGYDFYSVIGIEVFKKFDCTPYKAGPGSFGEMYPLLRQVAKVIALAATYGITAFKLTDMLNTDAPRKGDEGPWDSDEVQEIIDNYFEAYPEVKKLQLKYHREAIDNGVVFNIYGRPRHIPAARHIQSFGRKTKAEDLPYEFRTLLNNAVNFPIQGSAGSIMNRALIAAYARCRELEAEDPAWADVKIIGQVHDEGWLEGPEHLKDGMIQVLKESMEGAAVLPGVALIANPRAAYNLADLK